MVSLFISIFLKVTWQSACLDIWIPYFTSSMVDKATLPLIDALPSSVRLNGEVRSMHKQEEKDWENSKWLAKFFKEGAQVIVMPFSLEDLQSDSVSMASLEKICKSLENLEAQAMSAIFVDREHKPLLAYCTSRPDQVTPEVRSESYLHLILLIACTSWT